MATTTCVPAERMFCRDAQPTPRYWNSIDAQVDGTEVSLPQALNRPSRSDRRVLPPVTLDPLASAKHTSTHRPVAMAQGSLSRSKQEILEPKRLNV